MHSLPPLVSKAETFKQLSIKVAAFLLLLISLAAIVFFVIGDAPSIHHATTRIETVTLTDGSRVTLNRNSVLSLDADFDEDNRKVTLHGEAFFEVKADGENPFVIEAGNARVQVVGTSFNVNAYDSLKEVEVIVEAGIVRMQPIRGGQATDLLPGERGVIAIADSRMSVSVNEDMNFRSWNTQHLVFVEEHLLSVLQTLERTYHAKIAVNADVAQSCILTATFDKQSLSSVMDELKKVLNLTYTIEGNNVEISDVGC
jgi:ferric-dicitrate binding protein FerR (iron transport regulator)